MIGKERTIVEDQNLKRMQLLAKAQQGDAESASTLFSLCYSDLYFYASQILGQTPQAERCVSETIAKMCVQKSMPNSPAQFVPWMMYYCHFTCKKYLPQASNAPDMGGMMEGDIITAVIDETGILSEQVRKQMSIAIAAMSAEERAALILTYYDNFSIEQVGMICGMRPQIAEAYRSSGLRTLKAVALQNQGTPTQMPQNVSLGPTIACVLAAKQKNLKPNALAMYNTFCSFIRIAPSAVIVDQFTEKKPDPTQTPVVFNSAVYKKESFGERVKYWPKALKACLICLCCCILGVGVFFGIRFLKPDFLNLSHSSGTSDVSQTSIVTDPLQSDGTKNTRIEKTKKTYPTDENGNEIRPTIKVAKRTTKHAVGKARGTVAQNNRGGKAGGVITSRVYRTTQIGITRPKTTARPNSGGSGGDSGGSGGGYVPNSNNNQSGGNGGGPKKPTLGTKITAYRPAVGTTSPGRAVSSGKENSFSYSIQSNNTVYITGFSGSGVVNVPHIIEGKPVAAIADAAFDGNKKITEVYLPASVTLIGDYAFRNCSNLKSINLGGTVSIGLYAFKQCTSLNLVNWSNNLTRIGGSAFYGCSALGSAMLPATITTVEAMAFRDCTSLRTVKLSSRMKCIENNTFYNCKGLQTVELYAGLEYIGSGSFYQCKSLNTVIFHGSKSQWFNIPNDEERTNRSLASANIVYR